MEMPTKYKITNYFLFLTVLLLGQLNLNVLDFFFVTDVQVTPSGRFNASGSHGLKTGQLKPNRQFSTFEMVLTYDKKLVSFVSSIFLSYFCI